MNDEEDPKMEAKPNPIDITDASAIRESIASTQNAVVEFDKIAAGIAAIEEEHPKDVACDVRSAVGMRQAIAGRAAWREPRIAVEKARKAAKAPVLALGREIDSFAKRLEATLLEGESNYDRQIKAEEARREAERQAKIEAERVRVSTIRSKIDSIRMFPVRATGKMPGAIEELRAEIRLVQIDDSFEEFSEEAKQVLAASVATLDEMHAAAEAAVAETRRLREERQELERQRIEQEERVRAQREAEERRLEELRRKQEAELLEQRKAQEEEMRRRREAEDAARAEQDRIEAEQKAAEQRRLEAERAEIARQREEVERLQRAEADRIAKARAIEERAEIERRDAERVRLSRLQSAAQPLLDAAKTVLAAVEKNGSIIDGALLSDGFRALRAAVAMAECDLDPASAGATPLDVSDEQQAA